MDCAAQIEENWLTFYHSDNTTQAMRDDWFRQSGDFDGTSYKSLNSCGNSLPESLK